MMRAIQLRLSIAADTGLRLRELSKMSARGMTLAMQLWRAADADKPTLIQDHHPKKSKGKGRGRSDWSKIFGKRPDVTTYHALTDHFPTLATGVVSAICQNVRSLYLGDRFDVLVGSKRTREWRDSAPILVRGQNAKIVPNGDGYAIDCGLYSQKYDGLRRLMIPIRAIPGRLPPAWVGVLKTYAAGAKLPQLLIHCRGPRGKRKWYVDIPYKLEVSTTKDFDPDRILYVRRGDNAVEFLRCILPRDNRPDWTDILEWESALKIGEHNEGLRKSIQNKYRCDAEHSSRKGHGLKRCVETFERLRMKLRFRQRDFNYNRARYIVSRAIRWKCGTIHLEDLTQVPDASVLVLGAWPYYELKQRIALLCDEAGITLKLDKPIEAVIKEQENGDRNIGKAAKSKRRKTPKRKQA